MEAPSTGPSKLRLNLGCGHDPLSGFVNIDSYALEADVRRDIRELEFRNVDEVLMSHVLEHISWRDVPAVLQRIHSWMRKDGTLRVEVPDMGVITKEAMSNPDWIRYLYGSQEHEGEYHRTGFTVHSLLELLSDAGFRVVTAQSHRSTYRTRLGMPVIEVLAAA